MCDQQYYSKFWLVKNKIKSFSVLPGESFDLESIQNHVSSFANVLMIQVQAINAYSLGVQYNP